MTKTSRRLLLLLALTVLTSPVVFAVRVERLIDTWQPKHYVVDLTLNDQLSEIVTGSARIDVLILKKTSVIDLDFGELKTNSVRVDSKPASFTHRNGKLEITLSEPANPGTKLVVDVAYQGRPKDGLIMSKDKDGLPSAVGDNWPNRVHHWIPSLDHPSAKATAKFNVTAPARTNVVANGRLDQILTTSSPTKTWYFTQSVPIPPYCMIIAVGEFAQVVPPQQDITPLAYYVPLTEKDITLSGFAPAYPSLKYFTQTVGAYPYEKLALIVGSTRFGGMENSTAIVFSSTLFDPRANAKLSRTFQIREGIVSLVAHEIAHQWFGDSVTQSTWSDLWLSEGFATYFAALFIRHTDGERAFSDYMMKAKQTYLGSARSVRT